MTGQAERLLYAAYGSNLHPDRLRARVASARLAGTAFLDGLALTFDKRGIDGSGKAAVVEGGQGVHIAVYSIEAGEKPELDRLEHINVGYYDLTVDIPGYGECFMYTATEAYSEPGLKPYCWYRALVLQGSIAHGFPEDYIRGDSPPRRPGPRPASAELGPRRFVAAVLT